MNEHHVLESLNAFPNFIETKEAKTRNYPMPNCPQCGKQMTGPPPWCQTCRLGVLSWLHDHPARICHKFLVQIELPATAELHHDETERTIQKLLLKMMVRHAVRRFIESKDPFQTAPAKTVITVTDEP
jgi:hypothetical protein